MKPLRKRVIRFSDAEWLALAIACQLHGLKRSRVIRDGTRTEIERLIRSGNGKK